MTLVSAQDKFTLPGLSSMGSSNFCTSTSESSDSQTLSDISHNIPVPQTTAIIAENKNVFESRITSLEHELVLLKDRNKKLELATLAQKAASLSHLSYDKLLAGSISSNKLYWNRLSSLVSKNYFGVNFDFASIKSYIHSDIDLMNKRLPVLLNSFTKQYTSDLLSVTRSIVDRLRPSYSTLNSLFSTNIVSQPVDTYCSNQRVLSNISSLDLNCNASFNSLYNVFNTDINNKFHVEFK
jgi:hypothetical protein